MAERVSAFSAQHAVDNDRRGLWGCTVSFFDVKSCLLKTVCKVAETYSVAGLLEPPILALTNTLPLPLPPGTLFAKRRKTGSATG